ncbi:MAG: IS5 family transposase [Proteobacteria bacterium]|nr:IS5 family transposase [Pseudomonadota bacterium]
MARHRYDLTDAEWKIIEPLLPQKSRGVERVDDRRVLNGIFWRLRSGSPWAEIPERYGPSTTCYNRFVRWQKAGIWAQLLNAISEAYDGRVQMIDSTTVRVHQHAANGDKKGGFSDCMGRSRGGNTTKIHALVDRNGLPIELKLTPGQAHDGKSAEDMLDAVGKGTMLLADRGYDSDALREKLAGQGVRANIRPLEHRVIKPKFNPKAYKQRNLVERFFNKLKHYRAIATRFCRHDANYLASVQLAALTCRLLYLR